MIRYISRRAIRGDARRKDVTRDEDRCCMGSVDEQDGLAILPIAGRLLGGYNISIRRHHDKRIAMSIVDNYPPQKVTR